MEGSGVREKAMLVSALVAERLVSEATLPPIDISPPVRRRRGQIVVWKVAWNQSRLPSVRPARPLRLLREDIFDVLRIAVVVPYQSTASSTELLFGLAVI